MSEEFIKCRECGSDTECTPDQPYPMCDNCLYLPKATPQARVVEFPPCPFEDFLKHMTDSGSSEWTWTFIEMCARFGVLHSSPDCTLLMRPVSSKVPKVDLLEFNDLDPTHPLSSKILTFPQDTWHVLYASGDPSDFFDLCPYELEFISWHRNKGGEQIRIHSFQKLKEKFHGN